MRRANGLCAFVAGKSRERIAPDPICIRRANAEVPIGAVLVDGVLLQALGPSGIGEFRPADHGRAPVATPVLGIAVTVYVDVLGLLQADMHPDLKSHAIRL